MVFILQIFCSDLVRFSFCVLSVSILVSREADLYLCLFVFAIFRYFVMRFCMRCGYLGYTFYPGSGYRGSEGGVPASITTVDVLML